MVQISKIPFVMKLLPQGTNPKSSKALKTGKVAGKSVDVQKKVSAFSLGSPQDLPFNKG